MKTKELIEHLLQADPEGELDVFITPLILVPDGSGGTSKVGHPEIKYPVENVMRQTDFFSDEPATFLMLGFDDGDYISAAGDNDLVN